MAKQGARREDVFEYAMEHYGHSPEYLWASFPEAAILRRADNRKWYAVITNLTKEKLGLKGKSRIDILVIKCDPNTREMLMYQKGFLPAYHLNRRNWISVLLDGSVEKATLYKLLDMSYDLAKNKSEKASRTLPTEWLIPANPKYFDIEKAFAESDTILWKQSSSIIVGDIIYLYLTAPYSAVIYKCRALEVNIPYEYNDDNVHMQKVMKLQRLYTYDKAEFGLCQLKEHGIISVRGPRSVPHGLEYKLNKASER